MADKEFKVKNGLVVNNDLIWANNGQIGFNTDSPDANVTIVGTANVQGNSVITGTLSVGNTVTVSGNATFSNTITATGSIYTNQSLFVNAVANVKSSIFGLANLAITGNTTLGGTLSVANTTLINGPTTINAVATFTNTVSVSGPASFSNTVTVIGLANLASNANVGGNFAVTGNTSLTGRLAVTSNATFSNSMVVTGNVTFSNTLAVTGNVTLYSTINDRFVYEFLVANNASLYTITGQWRFSNSVTLSGALVDSTGYAGSTGQVLISNNTTVYWGAVGSASITAPGDFPANTQVIFNDRGSLSSNGSFTYNKDNYTLTTPVIVCSNGTLSLNATSSYFFANGLIAFGINNPTNKLHVVSSANNADGVIVRNTSSGTGARSIITVGTLGSSGMYFGQNADRSGYITLQDNAQLSLGANNTQSLYLSANGNIGIGNSTPGTLLTVNGAGRFEGSISVNMSNTSGGGIIFAGDGDIADLNDGWASLRFTGGLRIYSGNRTGSSVISLASSGAASFSGAISASGAISSSLGLSGTTGTFTSTVGINSGGSIPLQLTTSSAGPWGISLARSDTGTNSKVYNDNGSRWYFEHRPSFAGNTPLDSGNYNSYSPTLTGTGASGNWNINSVNITQYTINQNLGTGNSPTFDTLYAYIMYDRNDNGYYIDPGSTSRLNDIRPNIMYLPGNTGYRVWGGASDPSCRLGAVYADSVQSYGAVYGTVFYDQNDNNWYCNPNDTSRLVRLNLSTGNWNTSTEGWNRFYFSSSDSTYIRGGTTAQYWIRFGTQDNDTRAIFEGAGNFYTNGNVTAYWSDKRLKKNITKITNWREIIDGLNGYWYEWNDIGKKIIDADNNEVEVGLLAQEVKAAIPQAAAIQMLQYKDKKDGVFIPKDGINYDPENPYLTVREEKLIPVLVEAIKGLMEEVDTLKAKLGE